MANKKKKQQAVDFAHQMARQRQSYIDTESGATAYGGSQYSATKAQKQQASKDYAAWKERNAKRGTGSQTTSTGRATQPKQSDGLEVLRQAQAAMSGGAKQQTAPGQLPTIDPTHIMTPAERTELLLQTEERKQEQNKKQTKAARKALGDDEIATYIQNRDAAAREMKDLSLGDVLSNPLYAAGVALENLDYGVSDVARTLFNSKKQAEINRRVAEYNAAAPATPGGASAGQMIADIVNRGAANWTSGTAQTINTFAGAPLRAAGWKENPLQHFEEAMKANQDANQARYDMDFAEANGVQRKVGDIGTSTVEALPDMVLLAMTGPGKALAQGETALTRGGARLVGSEAARAGASAAAGAAATARQVAKNSLKNPMFWTSFSRVAGPSYNYAKQQGATDWEASVYATSNAVMNAQVEMSGGLQTLPWELQQGGRVALTYLKSMAQEGNEEVVQGMIERTLQNLAYGADNPVFSKSDPNAVINPRTAASEFGMGAAVSAVLGAPSSVAQGVENMSTREARAQEAEAAQRAARVADADAARARQNEAFGAPMQSGTADAEALAVLNRNAARRGEGGAQTAGAVQSTQQSTLSDPIARLIAGEAVGNKSLNQIRTNPEARARLENALGVQIPNSLTPSQFRAFVRYVAQYGAESNLSDESTTEGNLTAEPQTAPTQSETGQNVYDWTNRANGGSELGTASVYLMSRSIGGATDPAQMERFMLREGIPAESLQEAVDNGYIEFNGKQYVLTKRGEELITQMTREGVFSTQVDAPRKPSPAQPKTDAPGGDIGEEARTFSPEDHIDNRTDAYISKTSTKAFQHEHPELHEHFADIAQRIMEEAAISIDRGVTKVSKKNGGGTRAYYDKGLKAVIDRTGLSRNQVIRVCQDIINDQGSENYADAKRVEMALDALMSDELGEYGNAEYKRQKGEITGGTQPGSFAEYLKQNELVLALEMATEDELRAEWEALQQGQTAEAEQQSATPAENTNGGITVYRGYNRSDNPLENNLAQTLDIYDVLGTGSPRKDVEKIPLSYYTESAEDAGRYAGMDQSLYDSLVERAKFDYNGLLMRGTEPPEGRDAWIQRRAAESYKALTGRSAPGKGEVRSHTIYPKKTLDLTGLGEKATPDDVYRTISEQTGVDDRTLDSKLILSNISEGEPFDVFRILRNAPGVNTGSAMLSILRDNGFDSVRYSESGTNHYAMIENPAMEQSGAVERNNEANANGTQAEPSPSEPTAAELKAQMEEMLGRPLTEADLDGLSNQELADRIRPAMATAQTDTNGMPEGQGAASAGFDTTPENADYNAWSESADEVHPLGEKAVRDPQLPTVNPQGERTMRGGRTVMEAQSTTEERAQQIANQYVNGEMAYIPVKNKDLAAQAEASIEKEGWERSLRDWTARVRRGEVSKELMAMGATLINNAGNSGMDARSYLDLASDYVTLTHKAGQALQATRVLKNLSPSARLYMMQRSIYSIAEEMRMESGEIREDLVQRYNDAQTDAERDAVIDEIKDDVASRMNPSLLDKWNALRYTNMLGNFKTQGRNIIGNTTMGLVAAIRRRVDALIGGAAQAVTGGEFQRDVTAFYRPSLGTAAFEDFKNIERYAKGESKYSDAGGTLQKNEFLRDVNDRRRIFKNPILEGYRKLTKWAMEKGDDVFIRLTYADAMAQYLNAHGVTDGDALRSGAVDTEILDAAREYAVREAQEATFHDNNRFSSWVSQIGRGENTPKLVKGAIEGTMPFRKTPANIAVRGYEYSPLGVASALINTVQAANENSDVSANDAIRSWSKTVTGSAVLLAGFTLARMGILRGKDDDDDKKAAFDHLTGHQEYSIEIGGKSYTIDAFAPTCMPLLVGAEAARLTMENGWDVKNIEAALANLVDPMINMSMLQGVNDTLDNIKTADNSIIQLAELSALNYLTQGMTNTMLGQAERTFEPNRMTTYVDDESPLPSWMQRQIGKMSAKVPGWDYHQTEYIDSWGRKQSNGTLAERAFSNFLAPWYSNDVGSDSVETELERLYGKTKDSGLLPTAYAPSELKFDGEQRKATQGEKARYQTVYGQTAHSGLDELFKSSAYLSMTDEEKALAVSNLYEYSNDEGKRAAGADHETPDWAERGDASVVQNAGFYSILEAAKKQLDKDDREKTGPQMQAILDRGLSEEDTLGVFRHILTGSSESTMEKIESAPDPLYWARNYVNLQTSRDTLPEDMKSKNGPQMQAVLDSGASAEDALAQFRMITGDESKTVDKMRTLYDDDYPLDMIVGYYTAANEEGQFWSSYKNGYTKKRNQAAMIQYMMENYGLTRVQAKHMYDVFNGKA